MEKHSVGQTIAALRKKKGWTQVELAEKLQVSDKAVSKWEKDAAFPSVEFFPVLASLFGVSIDFLMTGKSPEKEVILISKMEMCAKNDEVSMIDEININITDESGKTVMDYIVQYESLKVFSAICDKYINDKYRWNALLKKVDFKSLFKLALISNRIDVLSEEIVSCLSITSLEVMKNVKKGGIKNLFHVEKSDVRYMRNETSIFCITDDMIDIIVCDNRVSESTISYVLSKHPYMTSVWFQVLPYIIHQSYLHGNNELLKKCLRVAVENNQYAYDKYDHWYSVDFLISKAPDTFGYVPHEYFERGLHGLFRILKKTTVLALERGDFNLVALFNKINLNIMENYKQCDCYIANDDEIRVAKLKKDSTVSKEELAIQSALHCGVLCIDEILATKDYKLIKKALETYPVTTYELKCSFIETALGYLATGNWRSLFEYAVDNGYKTLVKCVLARDVESGKKFLNSLFDYIGDITYPDGAKSNSNHMVLRDRTRVGKDHASKMAFILACKKQIIDDCALKLDMDRVTDDLDEAYFRNELAKGNFEIVIIKLCVRLEAVLRGKYHLEGDFSEMINQYCSKYGTEDDGWGYDVEAGFVKYLHKLRKCRNGIVHSEKTSETMSIEELKYCIEYICKMR